MTINVYRNKKYMRTTLILIAVLSCQLAMAQKVEKENLTKAKSTFWDFNKTQLQSVGKCYKDEFGETNEKHGKWTYYDRLGEVEEVRYYYRDMLHGQVTLYFPNGKNDKRDSSN